MVRTREPLEVDHRDVEPADVAAKLRGMLGLAPHEPAAGEEAAGLPRPLPPLVRRLDSGAWIGWCVIGLALFGEGFPSLAAVRREPKRFTMALAMVRAGGNISAAARMLGASRKVLRENLQQAGLHPWRAVHAEVGVTRGPAALHDDEDGGDQPWPPSAA